jgi:hypothetical protein
MGAWSHEPFGNDTACDWSHGVLASSDLSLIEAAIDAVLAVGNQYLEATDAEEAIGAMEVLAKLRGKDTQLDGYTAGIDAWVRTVAIPPPAPLLAKALAALAKVLSHDSELRELWDDSDAATEWRASMAMLRAALST